MNEDSGLKMKNRAKCKLCESILDFLDGDYLVCKCGELTLDGIHKKVICEKSDNNFVQVDDEGNEIVLNSHIELSGNSGNVGKSNKKELLSMLDQMISNVENLPQGAMLSPVTHYDYVSLMILLSSILKVEE